MASAFSDLKQKPKLLVIASDPSYIKNAGFSHTNSHQSHIHKHHRCSPAEALNGFPCDHECLHVEAPACVSDSHGCSSSFENSNALRDQSKFFSKCQNDAVDGVIATTGSLFGDDGHGTDKCFDNGISSLSITDGCDAASHVGARLSQFDEMVRKSSRNGDVHHGLCAESMDDVIGPHAVAVNTGNVNYKDKEVQHSNGDLRNGHGNLSHTRGSKDGAEKAMQVCNDDSQHALDAGLQKPAKRPFCKRCEKAQDLCICNRFKGVVRNKIKITILQNPKEKHHAVGSARVALLGLENVALIDVPEIYSKETFRIRPKVPGSKRSLAGRGGKKILLKGGKLPVTVHDAEPSDADILQMKDLLTEICDSKCEHLNACDTSQFSLCSNGKGEMVRRVTPEDRRHESTQRKESIGAKDAIMNEFRSPEETSGLLSGKVSCGCASNERFDRGALCLEELEALIPPGLALLYPSDKAIELSQLPLHSGSWQEGEFKAPCQLIVLDGTWSKARRIYFENPWLQSLPHYKLSLSAPSLYEGVRKQPKPGCLSTLESIVYALKVFEPDTEGLDGLLEVFDSMVEDQRRCKHMKCGIE